MYFPEAFVTYWCLVGNGWEWGLLGLLYSDYGSFPHSLRLAPVSHLQMIFPI